MLKMVQALTHIYSSYMAIDIDEDGETDEFDVISRSKEPAVKQQPR